jgi:ABC-type polysaccharide/polyol phosphate export permease
MPRLPFKFPQALQIVLVLGFMETKQRYQNSLLGIFWSVLKPLALFSLYFGVFGILFKAGNGPDYALRLFLGVILWVLFTESTSLGLQAFLGRKTIVTKIRVNPLLLPVVSFVSPLINFAVNASIFAAAYLLLLGRPAGLWTPGHLLLAGVSLAAIALLIVSINIILANLNAMFRDVEPIWELALTYGIFLTPIMYPLPVPERWRFAYYCLNPLALALDDVKSLFFRCDVLPYRDAALMASHGAILAALFAAALWIHQKLYSTAVDYL